MARLMAAPMWREVMGRLFSLWDVSGGYDGGMGMGMGERRLGLTLFCGRR